MKVSAYVTFFINLSLAHAQIHCSKPDDSWWHDMSLSVLWNRENCNCLPGLHSQGFTSAPTESSDIRIPALNINFLPSENMPQQPDREYIIRQEIWDLTLRIIFCFQLLMPTPSCLILPELPPLPLINPCLGMTVWAAPRPLYTPTLDPFLRHLTRVGDLSPLIHPQPTKSARLRILFDKQTTGILLHTEFGNHWASWSLRMDIAPIF